MSVKLRFSLRIVEVALFLIAQVHLACSQDAEPVAIAIYYESLCPDSHVFVREQLSVVYPQLYDIMQVDINAYGKAIDVESAEGGYNFVCQHGPEECSGNQMLACAKTYLTEEKDYVDFNICVMTSEDPPNSGENCTASLGLAGWPTIYDCWTSVEGEILLHNIGVKTKALDPPADYIPWMVYDGNHTAEIQDQIEHDLFNFVCTNYAGEPPAECSAD